MLVTRTITGLRRNDHHFTTVVSFQWLLENIISGLVLEDAARDMAEGKSVDKRAAELAPLREKMQRPFQILDMERRSIRGEVAVVPRLRPTAKMRNTQGDLRDYLVQQFAVSPE